MWSGSEKINNFKTKWLLERTGGKGDILQKLTWLQFATKAMLQTQFTRCKTLLRTHENSERSGEHETRLSMSYLVTPPEHDQDMN